MVVLCLPAHSHDLSCSPRWCFPKYCTPAIAYSTTPPAWGIGLAGYLGGIRLSMVFDYSTGALIVWAMTSIAIASAWFLPALLGETRGRCFAAPR